MRRFLTALYVSPLLSRGLLQRSSAPLVFLVFIGFAGCSTPQGYQSASSVTPSVEAININTATFDQLEQLPHIGRKTAETIVEFRTQNGPFRRVEHLMQIRGISEERFVELRPFIKTE